MNVIEHLNDKQKASVLSEAKRVLVLAGAGSGKTKTVISKLLYLVAEKGVKSSSILAITFTKNAANEMIDRLIISSDATNTYESFIQNKSTTFKHAPELVPVDHYVFHPDLGQYIMLMARMMIDRPLQLEFCRVLLSNSMMQLPLQ